MTSTETQNPTHAASPNLRETRKEQAAKKAPAKKAAPKAAVTTAPAARKLRWQVEGDDRNAKGGKNQTAVVGDHAYSIAQAGEGWTATVTVDGGKPEVLSELSFAKAYAACVAHNRARA